MVHGLVPEPDNPYEPAGHALAVLRIAGNTVGYLERAHALEYRDVVHRLVSSGIVPQAGVRVWAVTRFSSKRGRDELKASIRLNIRSSGDILPVNPAPSTPHALIPPGRSLQVTGEADHLDVIAPYVGDPAGEPIVATLHPIDVHKARSTDTVLEVRLDDHRVGQLPPATSSSLLPLVREAEKLGRITAAWAKVKGSRFAADVTLQAQKAEEVPNSWPTANDTIPRVSSNAGPVPGAYVAQRELVPPPTSGLSGWVVVLGVAAILILASIPAVGPIFFIGGAVGLIYWYIAAKRQAPRGAPRTIGH